MASAAPPGRQVAHRGRPYNGSVSSAVVVEATADVGESTDRENRHKNRDGATRGQAQKSHGC
jgi:hypothetical protein